MLDEAEHEQLAARVDAAAHELLQRREAVVEALLEAADLAVRVRHDPRRGALDHVHLRGLLLDLGHELDRRRAGADGGHALAAEVVVVVPAGGVERLALEVLEPLDRRRLRLGERAHAGHHDAGAQRPVGGLDRPAAVLPLDALDRAVQPHVLADAVLVRAAAQVVADLGLARVGLAPPRVGREGERVEVRGHVAGAPRVGVVVPRAADVVTPLEHREVLDPLLLEANRHAEAREAAADDRCSDVKAVHNGFLPRNLHRCNIMPNADDRRRAARAAARRHQGDRRAARLPRDLDRGGRPRGRHHAPDRLRPLPRPARPARGARRARGRPRARPARDRAPDRPRRRATRARRCSPGCAGTWRPCATTPRPGGSC